MHLSYCLRCVLLSNKWRFFPSQSKRSIRTFWSHTKESRRDFVWVSCGALARRAVSILMPKFYLGRCGHCKTIWAFPTLPAKFQISPSFLDRFRPCLVLMESSQRHLHHPINICPKCWELKPQIGTIIQGHVTKHLVTFSEQDDHPLCLIGANLLDLIGHPHF